MHHHLTGTQVKFMEMLRACLNNGNKASLLIDDHGYTRVEGFIANIDEILLETTITMQDGRQFSLNDLIAINGYFDPLKSTC